MRENFRRRQLNVVTIFSNTKRSKRVERASVSTGELLQLEQITQGFYQGALRWSLCATWESRAICRGMMIYCYHVCWELLLNLEALCT